MAELFEIGVGTVNHHLKEVFADGEIPAEATVRRRRIVRTEGNRSVSREIEHYRLEAVLAVGFRVYAATGSTAAEIVRLRADATRSNMGLTSWSGDRVIKRDVGTAKNYLDDEEIDTLNRIVVMFLDRAEFRAQRRKDIRMADWAADLDKFLVDTELPVLATAGTVSHEVATTWASEQYDAFAERRRVEAEAKAEAKYLEDLTAAAKLLEGSKNPVGPKPPKRRKKP
jgi:hypothetical protein